MFCKKSVLTNFAKFTGKHLYQSLFFNKVADLRPATLLRKRPWYRFFPVNFAKFLRTLFLTEHLQLLLLDFNNNKAINGIPKVLTKQPTFNHLSKIFNLSFSSDIFPEYTGLSLSRLPLSRISLYIEQNVRSLEIFP